MRPTEDIYLHLGGDGTYSLKPDLIPGEVGSLNKSSRCAGASLDSARRNCEILAPYYDYIRPQLSATLILVPIRLTIRERGIVTSVCEYYLDNIRVTAALIKNRCIC